MPLKIMIVADDGASALSGLRLLGRPDKRAIRQRINTVARTTGGGISTPARLFGAERGRISRKGFARLSSFSGGKIFLEWLNSNSSASSRTSDTVQLQRQLRCQPHPADSPRLAARSC